MRLDKFISYALDLSRADAKKVIKSKEVKVNDKVIIDIGYIINLDHDEVKRGDEVIYYEEFIYLMMNKPAGYLSATIDKNKTVMDLVTEYKKYELFIAGRLDIDSLGLLIITNDGDLAHKLTSPKSLIYKTYYVEVDGEFELDDIEKLKEGIVISDGKGGTFKTLPAELEIITKNSAYIRIAEGKFHQIKNMCLKLGKQVQYLKRQKIGNLKLDENLKEGEYRKLTNSEIELLKTLTKNGQ